MARAASRLARLRDADALKYCVAVFLLLLALLYIERAFIANKLQEAYEAIDLAFAYSPAKAYAYGEEHFSDAKPASYDLSAANYFFKKAAAGDRSLPYVYHELARIAFLEGDFNLALSDINIQILDQADKTPASYYVRGLIEGFMGNYADSENDYAYFLRFDPDDWAGVNDYAWVLLKDGKPQEAAAAIESVLQYFPNNPWLLNSDAIALYQIGSTTAARARIAAASDAVNMLKSADWSRAYPGNDPLVAGRGLSAFKDAVINNMHTIEAGAPIDTLQ